MEDRDAVGMRSRTPARLVISLKIVMAVGLIFARGPVDPETENPQRTNCAKGHIHREKLRFRE